MFERILVAYDGSASAQAALGLGVGLAKGFGAELASVSVEEHLPRYAATISEVEGAKEQIDEHFRALTKAARARAALEGVALDTLVRQGHEVQEILGVTREGRFDLLVLGAHGHSRVFERIVGSTSLTVTRLAPCSVLIVRVQRTAAEGLGQIKRILVGVDGSPLGRLAFRVALDFAILCGATVVGMTVRQVSPLSGAEGPEAGYVRQLRSAAEEHARAAGVVFEPVARSGHAAQALRDGAREASADLIVLGATGLERPWSVTIGGTASSVAGEAPCSVLLVRPSKASLHVRDVMVRAVSSVTGDTPLAEVVELLLRRSVKALPVLDARRHVVGIITGGDLLRSGGLRLRLSVKQELDEETLRAQFQALARSRRSARDVMTRHVHTVEGETDLATVIRMMVAHRVKRLPVVDVDKEMIGLVSRADVLRALASLPEAAEPAARELTTVTRTVADAATSDVPAVGPAATADEVLNAVLESPLRRVVVIDANGTVRGLISDRDLLARTTPDRRSWLVRVLLGERGWRPDGAAGKRPAGLLNAAALMAPSLVTVRPGDSLAHAIRLMMQHRVKRLVVVDDAGRFRGLVDRREVLRLLAEPPPPGPVDPGR